MTTKLLLHNTAKQQEKIMVKEYNLTPFLYNIFPFQKDRFCIIIISQHNNDLCKNLLQYILNSFLDEEIVENCNDLYQLKREFETGDKNKMAIIDISPDNRFKSIHDHVIEFDKTLYTKWTKNFLILRAIFPNILRSKFVQKNTTHFSHTIWLASSFDDVPECLYTNRNIVFIIDQNQINYLFNVKLRVQRHVTVNNAILCVDILAKKDIQFATMSKANF